MVKNEDALNLQTKVEEFCRLYIVRIREIAIQYIQRHFDLSLEEAEEISDIYAMSIIKRLMQKEDGKSSKPIDKAGSYYLSTLKYEVIKYKKGKVKEKHAALEFFTRSRMHPHILEVVDESVTIIEQTLNKREMRLFELIHIEGCSKTEAAEIMGLSRVHIHRLWVVVVQKIEKLRDETLLYQIRNRKMGRTKKVPAMD